MDNELDGDSEKGESNTRDLRSKMKGEKDISREIINTLETIESDYTQFKDTISSLKGNLQRFMDETETKLQQVDQKAEQKVEEEVVEEKVNEVEDEVDEVDERLEGVMSEMGYGQSVEVTKVPPVLLEGIYQATLNETVEAMRDNLGDHDTQQLIQEELEKMRSRTSGSELFQYDGRKIKLRNIVSSIENNLISAKQIHSTYQEIIDNLSEKVPDYEPSNFRAMINYKGLEYAIEKSTELVDRTDDIDHRLYEVDNKVERVHSELDERIEERLGEFEERLESISESIEELSSLSEKVEDIEEEIQEISSKYDEMSSITEEVEELKEEMEGKEISLTEEESLVYYSLPEDGATLKKTEKNVGDELEDVEALLGNLVDKGKVKKEQRGRWTVYMRSEEIEEEPEDEETIEEEPEEELQGELQEEEIVEEEEVEEETEEGEEIEEVEDGGEEKEGSDRSFEGINFDETGFGKVEREEEEVEQEGELESETEGLELEEEQEELQEDIEDKVFKEKGEGKEEERVEEELDEEVKERDEQVEEGGEEIKERLVEGKEAEKEEGEAGIETGENDGEEYEGEEGGSELTDEERSVMSKIPDDGCTIHQIDKHIEEFEKDEIEDILEDLMDKDRVSTTKRNRWTIYLKQKEAK